MAQSPQHRAVTMLRLVVGLTLFSQALVLALPHGQLDPHFGPDGYAPWMRHALAWSEIVGAAFFLWPHTIAVGGTALVFVLLWASALHVGLGESPPVSFLTYVVAIYVVMIRSSTETNLEAPVSRS